MKKTLLSFLSMLVTMTCVAQGSLARTYDYDDAGNRVLRATIELRMATKNQETSKTVTTETDKSLYYEESIGEVSVKVFPNPTQGLVTLQFSHPVGNGYYKLYSMAGQVVSEGIIESATSTIDLSACRTGAYMLTLTVNGMQDKWKIIKK